MNHDILNLSHQSSDLPGGGEVFVLDVGATISPEAQAMLAALHSRSPGGIRNHLAVLAEKGADKFMSTFYVGYGHKSIGDNANASVFIEGVSMLAAKAIQDFPLYNGQEVSTRYVNFSEQRFIDPVGSEESHALLENLRAFYLQGLEELLPVLRERFPRAADENEAVYEKAIAARAFDTMRAFLPAGASTNLAWVGELRQFADRIPVLRHHPLAEIRAIADATEKALLKAFPSSFSDKRYEATEEYLDQCGKAYTYFDDPECPDFALVRDDINRDRLGEFADALSTRPNNKTELPQQIRECGMAEFRFLLDFGSFRDIQRHRAVTIRMPLLTADHGFEPWYLGELPADLRKRAEAMLAAHVESVKKLGIDKETAQYYLPMGFRTAVRLTGDLRALTYLVELRATRFVHPTLRARARQMASALTERFGKDGLVLHLDTDPDRFDVRRGEHDIVRTDTSPAQTAV
ncbi:MAG TPA: FAD-dependent thymidylate synthase [Candidatus Paceibacterota bacterium]